MYKQLFLQILKQVDQLQDFLGTESLGQIAKERDQLRRVLDENVELHGKVEQLERIMNDDEDNPASNSKKAKALEDLENRE